MTVAIKVMAMTLTIPTLECPRWSSADTIAVMTDDEEDDVSLQEEEEEVEVEANSGKLPPVYPLVRSLRVKKKQTHYEPLSSEFTKKNVSNVCSNLGHFQPVI